MRLAHLRFIDQIQIWGIKQILVSNLRRASDLLDMPRIDLGRHPSVNGRGPITISLAARLTMIPRRTLGRFEFVGSEKST